MAIRREDYILELIEELQAFVAQALDLADSGKLGEALMAIVRAQEKLFARPMAEFVPLGIEAQLRLLTLDETPDRARTKVLAYALLLTESGKVYGGRGRRDLAASAFRLALYATLTVAVGNPARAGELGAAIADLRDRLNGDPLNPPLQELLGRLG